MSKFITILLRIFPCGFFEQNVTYKWSTIDYAYLFFSECHFSFIYLMIIIDVWLEKKKDCLHSDVANNEVDLFLKGNTSADEG